ncbi:CACNA1B, partial [Symbiodinium sp. CCMP2456]
APEACTVPPAWTAIADYVFYGIYVVELLLRVGVYGVLVFKSGWVKFDCFLVVTASCDMIIKAVDSTAVLDEFNIFMLVRMLRLARLARAVRLMVQFKTLWQLVQGLWHSKGTLLWTFLLISILMYVGAVMGMELIRLDPDLELDHPFNIAAGNHFRDFFDAVLTLLQVFSLDSIGIIYKPLIKHQFYLLLYFMSFLLLLSIALMNLVTAVMVNSSLDQATQDPAFGDKRELLVLPAELLFDAKALPLTDQNLRQGAAASLFRSCDAAFGFLLGAGSDGQDLRILGAWLRAVRKAQLWLPTGDVAAPLRCLAQYLEPLCSAALMAKAEASEVAQQLAKWRGAPKEAAALLGPLCSSLFQGDSSMEAELREDSLKSWLLPLLVDLAEDFWPRAAVGELDLDWELIARQAFALLGEAAQTWDGTHSVEEFDDVETTISVWQAFAETLHAAVRAADTFSLHDAGQAAAFQPPPEKRSRRANDRWQLSRHHLAQATSISSLFSLLLQTLLDCMRLPEFPEDEEALGMLQRARHEVEAALKPWAALLTNSETWIAELWEPLRRVEELLSGVKEEEGDFLTFQVARDIEVVIWFFGAFCASLPEGQPSHAAAEAASRAISSIAPQLAHLDAALPPWRA